MDFLEDVIENFSIDNLTLFFRNKLNSFCPREEDFEHLFNDEILEIYKDIQKIGEAELQSGEDIIVITTKTLKELTSRTSKKQQYEIAKRILKEEDKDAAFLVFYDDNGNFRFSFIRTNYKGTKRDFSDFKRYTYFVSPDQTNKTFKKQIEQANFESLDSIQEAFSVEPLNKEFYQNISKAFYSLVGGKIGLGAKEKIYKKVLKLPTEDKKIYQNFAVRLIGRIIFVWFLKKKVSSNGIPLIPKDWLTSKKVKETDDYYHEYLEKLFFEILNKKLKDRPKYLPEGHEIIPFLNGGLFEPQKDDFYESNKSTYSSLINELIVPNKWIEELFKTLEQFNFTIDENSIDDQEVSIDPEMLGTIFENLLAEIDPDTQQSARKATGSYYTPREIVDYMVEQSLIEYLKDKTGIKEEKLKKLFKNTEEDPKFMDKERHSIIDSLDSIKIIDPACGSGSFLMGALHKINTILQKVDKEAEIWKEKKLSKIDNVTLKEELKRKLSKSSVDYSRKLGIIQDSLYGVDIQEIAIEIAKLRFFLSIVVDEEIYDNEDNRGIFSLPNLEFKLIAANTLIRLEKEKRILTLDAYIGKIEKYIDEIKKLRHEYMRAYGQKKETLKKEFPKIIRNMAKIAIGKGDYNKMIIQIMGWNPFENKRSDWFDSEWMFGVKEFDIVIGNPPHGANIHDIKEKIQKTYQFYETRKNSASIFIELSKTLLTKKGILSFVIPKSFLFVNSWERTRNFVVFKNRLMFVIDISKAFESVKLEQILLSFKKELLNENYEFKTGEFWGSEIKIVSYCNTKLVKQLNLIPVYVDNQKINILNKMTKNSVMLKQISETFRGLPFQKKINQKGKISILRGSNLGKYFIYGDIPKISLSDKEIKNSKIKKIQQRKIVSQNIVAHVMNPFDRIIIMATLDNKGYLTLDTVMNTFVIDSSFNYSYVLGILNSKLSEWFYYWLVYGRAIRTMHFDKYYMGKLPIKEINKENKHIANKIETLVDIIIANKERGEDTSKEEFQIDLMVYKLYKLTYDEVKVVDPEFPLTKEEYDKK